MSRHESRAGQLRWAGLYRLTRGRYELSIQIALDPEADLVFAVVPEASEGALVERVGQVARALGDGTGRDGEGVPGGAGLLRLRVGPLPAWLRPSGGAAGPPSSG